MKTVTITTDGSCFPNPGPGGWAALLRYGGAEKWISGSEANATNNTMEFRAILEAVRMLREPCEVVIRTDSKTAIAWAQPHSFAKSSQRAKYAHAWPTVQEFREVSKIHRIRFEWIQGHAGDTDNEGCDRMASEARRRGQEARFRATNTRPPF